MNQSSLYFTFFFFVACKGNNDDINTHQDNFAERPAMPNKIKAISLPAGYERMALTKGSFGDWLRAIGLKKDKHVYLYNGMMKKNQLAQFVVLDIPVGKKDLQQCADAVMRLWAEYLFEEKRHAEIVFSDNNGKLYAWRGRDNKTAFDKYLEKVFSYCGTASLEKQLKPVTDLQEIKPGDVFIKGGFPGHTMIVVDAAINKQGKKIFMLAQSYMPAQDIHVVNNVKNEKISPWYEIGNDKTIVTPEWTFYSTQLRKF